ncbi:bcl-2/adenovirus E1B 19 kDa-interacting protein 2-like protein isoform X2 [Cololabis saira]|uniref:bcl-2/adenovirus E1B 19 kDa-interacting protein 2-like protein isoform X2 n=1 Tax=Cololabis saira TaxID=129043 RepID=UPI002AD538CB|nr:bcl-2/adenovirus E1B 19 kDa-interacting protein 2-like protein isoform X2 [Cololabis saira]
MESRANEQEHDMSRSFLDGDNPENIKTPNTTADTSGNTPATTALPQLCDHQIEDEKMSNDVVTSVSEAGSAAEGEVEESREEPPAAEEEREEGDKQESEEPEEPKPSTSGRGRPDPPNSLALSGRKPVKKKILVAPALSLSLGGSGSMVSDDFPSAVISPSLEDDDEARLDIDLDALETPSDSESLHLPGYDLDLEDNLQRLAVGTRGAFGSRSRSGSRAASLPGEDVVDGRGTRWRSFSMGDPSQPSRVNMSVLEPFLRVLSHGGYYGDGMNDIIVFSSCYLPENSLENYQYVMDNLFRFVVGTLELMVTENYVIVYLCAGGQKDKLPGVSWLKECYTTIDRRLRKNLKGFYVVHPMWYIKAVITIIKPFISSKFSRKLQFVDSLLELSSFVPTEHVQIPDCVRQYDQNLSR